MTELTFEHLVCSAHMILSISSYIDVGPRRWLYMACCMSSDIGNPLDLGNKELLVYGDTMEFLLQLRQDNIHKARSTSFCTGASLHHLSNTVSHKLPDMEKFLDLDDMVHLACDYNQELPLQREHCICHMVGNISSGTDDHHLHWYHSVYYMASHTGNLDALDQLGDT